MKKFLIGLFMIIILAGVCLFFGWAQLGVPPDSYGVIRSKTHGIDERLVVPGEFRWVWYKIIPTNATTSVFRLNQVSHSFSAQNTLPSGRVYAAFAGIDESFAWEVNASFSFTINPDALVSVVETHNIGNQEELTSYQNDTVEQIKDFILRRFSSDGRFSHEIEELLSNGESSALEEDIQMQFPSIANFSLRLRSARFPDFVLYNQIKGLYEYFVTFQREHLAGDLRETARNRIDSYLRLDELEQYGALLSKYPILLDYLALAQKGNE
ncbi:MAG: hypothetical protein LBI06_02025 [Treponema sp.]|jgi:hypothetical protein|nr:hypothetical protein [Treponema sp.]